jgi:hypothetical protein
MTNNAECGMRNAELQEKVRSPKRAIEFDSRTLHSALRIPHSALGEGA